MSKLRSWKILVKPVFNSSTTRAKPHYVVARTAKSAIRQAKAMEGYPYRYLDSRAGVIGINVLEELE